MANGATLAYSINRIHSRFIVYTYSILQYDNQVKAHLQSYTNIATLYASCTRLFTIGILLGFGLPSCLLILYSWREQAVSLFSSVSSICISIIVSEFLLFVSFFWYRISYGLYSIEEGISLPSTQGLSLTITLILTTASCFTSYQSILSDKNIDNGLISILLIILTSLFCFIQVVELLSTQLYINNGIVGTSSLFLTNLHCSHVLVGSIIILFCYGYSHCVYMQDTDQYKPFGSSTISIIQKDTCALIYWHFVELVWLFIQFVLYSE